MNTAKSKGSVISIEGFSNGTTETIIQAGEFRFVIDEPESFGGCNKAPSPVAYLLGAVSGCIVAIGMQVAKELGMTITKLNTKVDGSINSEAFSGSPRMNGRDSRKFGSSSMWRVTRLRNSSAAGPRKLRNAVPSLTI